MYLSSNKTDQVRLCCGEGGGGSERNVKAITGFSAGNILQLLSSVKCMRTEHRIYCAYRRYPPPIGNTFIFICNVNTQETNCSTFCSPAMRMFNLNWTKFYVLVTSCSLLKLQLLHLFNKCWLSCRIPKTGWRLT